MAHPRNTVRDDDGREVFGLSFTWDKQARKHRYYVTESKPTKWLGYDMATAIATTHGLPASANVTHRPATTGEFP